MAGAGPQTPPSSSSSGTVGRPAAEDSPKIDHSSHACVEIVFIEGFLQRSKGRFTSAVPGSNAIKFPFAAQGRGNAFHFFVRGFDQMQAAKEKVQVRVNCRR